MSRQHLSWCYNLKFDPSDVAESRKIFRNVDDTLSYVRVCTDRGCLYPSAYLSVIKVYVYLKSPLVTYF